MTSDVELPTELKVGRFAEARVKEILGLEAITSSVKRGKLAAQQLPRHLRRRAVSHQPKRLPRRLRVRHLSEREKSGSGVADKAKKRPSRKHRRRPANLLDEYNRRQRRIRWLETHIWHAKRFHITDRWGYRIPEFPNDKGFRSCYRAATKTCLMQDVSFMCCVELSGDEKELLTTLSNFSNPEESDFDRPDCLRGICQGQTNLYHPGQYPRGFVGQVTFVWKPREAGAERVIWIWIHPAFYKEFLGVLFEKLNIEEDAWQDSTEEKFQPPPAKKRKAKDVNVSAKKLEPRNVPFARTPKFESPSRIRVCLLRDTLNRFRLVGPSATEVLASVLQKTSVTSSEDHASWWVTFYKEEAKKQEFEDEFDEWNRLSRFRPGHVMPGSVASLVVRDPRVLLPQKRGGERKDVEIHADGEFLKATSLCSGPIWDPECRDAVTLTKCAEAEVNKRRSQNLVPGTKLELTVSESRVPVMLIQQPGDEGAFGAGWDIVTPAGWGMPFWVSLYYHGARVCGLREMNHFCLEKGSPEQLLMAPDSTCGIVERKRSAEVLTEVYFRYPPDKRVNYCKLGTASPFEAPFQTLVQEFQADDPGESKFFVMRDLKQLQLLRKTLQGSQGRSFPGLWDEALVPVTLELVGKGNASANSMICIPSADDVTAFKASDAFGGPEEPQHQDFHETLRKELRQKHEREKQSLRRKWKEAKDKLAEYRADCILNKIPIDGTESLKLQEEVKNLKSKREIANESFNEQMRSFWLPRIQGSLRHSCSREVIGFVTAGAYSLRRGHAFAVGLVVKKALDEFYLTDRSKASLVLVREPSATQYRFARIHICVS